MRFRSILFDLPRDAAGVDAREQPEFFTDLNLDQVGNALTRGRGEYNLLPFFYTPLHDAASVQYRHEILRELEKDDVRTCVNAFAEKMRSMRRHLAQIAKLHYRYHKEGWFLDAVDIYREAVSSLSEDLAQIDVGSRGFLALRDYLADYTASGAFTTLVAQTRKLHDDLAAVTYSIHIKGNRVRVSHYNGEPDNSVQVQETFAKFRQTAVPDHRVFIRDLADMNHVEAQVLGLVARLYPDVFQLLDEYCDAHSGYVDEVIGRFDREVQFYLAYLEFMRHVGAAGLPFCYPEVTSGASTGAKEVRADDAFDIALASSLDPAKSTVVRNDFYLTGAERILVVSGPNQGGKTTFARMFGQLHYLASLGCPVPGRRARLFLPSQMFTHFEKEEDITTLQGKLEDELSRIHDILQRATANSILIMNESFTSTTLNDALALGTEVIRQIMRRDMLCVYVTFVDELASLGEATVSMMSTVVPDNPAERTYKVIRKPADGLAYAAAIAEKYGLTYRALRDRVTRDGVLRGGMAS